MLRVHRDFKGLLKDVQDEYDFLADGLPALLITIRKFTWAGTRSRKKQSWLG